MQPRLACRCCRIHHRSCGHSRRPCARPTRRHGRDRHRLRYGQCRLRRHARWRTGRSRHRPARAGDDGCRDRRRAAFGRLGVRPRRSGRRDCAAAPARPRLLSRQHQCPDRRAGHHLRPPERRRQGLGPHAALLGAGLAGDAMPQAAIPSRSARPAAATAPPPPPSRGASDRPARSRRPGSPSVRSSWSTRWAPRSSGRDHISGPAHARSAPSSAALARRLTCRPRPCACA